MSIGAFGENFPYTNYHSLNLDWIVQKLKEAYSPDNPPQNVVLSVNGETGEVVLYEDAIVRLPDVTEDTWNIHRMANEQSSGIQFTPTKAQRISGDQRYDLYDSNNPPPYPVTSVNGATGAVQLYPDPVVRFPDIQEGTWNVNRVANGSASGIQFTPTKAQRIVGANRYDMYDSNNPPPYPVTSVNGQTGAVQFEFPVTSVNGQTGNVTITIPVTSVNGQTGAVVIPPDFTSDNEIMEFTQPSEGNYWGLSREVSTGSATIYLDTSNNTVKAYIAYESTDGQTAVTLPLLTSADIPSSSGVISINAKTGVVNLYGSDIYTNGNSQTTVAQDLASHGTAIANLQQTQSTDHTSLIQTRSQLSTAQTNITNLQGRMTNAENAEQTIMESIAILVTGNTSATGASAGQYVYVKGSSITGITDGLYKASQAIPANTVIDSSYLTAVPNGGMNSLNDRISNIDYFTLINAENITPTLTTFTLYQGRRLEDYKYALAIVKRGTYYRASMLIPVSLIYANGNISLTEVDSTNTQRWYEIKYVNPTTVTIQSSSNATDAIVWLYGVN